MIKRAFLTLFSCILLSLPSADGRSLISNFILDNPDTSEVHELTIYVIPSYSHLNWESPASLYRSTFESYTKSLFKRYKYSIGHLFIEFSTPLIDSVVFTSIRPSSDAQKRKLVLHDKVGLGMLGAVLHGRMESRAELTKKMAFFSKKGQLAFIKYRLNRESALRVVQYLKTFTTESPAGFTPCDYYGGAFWPLFENEGAGCSSFGIAAMEVAGLYTDYPQWRYSVNIPMNIIGGEYNNHLKVKQRTILHTTEWYSGKGVENLDFVTLTLYDPSLIFNWILERRKTNTDEAAEVDKVRGLYIDCRSISVPQEIFVPRQRYNPSLFINVFRNNTK